MMKIGFIGTGEIAGAMVNGLINKGHNIFVSERNREQAAKLAQYSDVSVASNQQVVDSSDVVFLCLMKSVAESELPKLKFRAEQRLVSVMVDVPLSRLADLCAPATDISITIPLPFIATGGCPLPCFPHQKTIKTVFGGENPVFEVSSERALNAHFAISAMASTTFAQTKTGAEWLGEITGDAGAAEIYLVAMLGGFLKGLPLDGNNRIEEALDALSTEGGLNATLRKHMADAGAEMALADGLDTFKERLGLEGG